MGKAQVPAAGTGRGDAPSPAGKKSPCQGPCWEARSERSSASSPGETPKITVRLAGKHSVPCPVERHAQEARGV